MRSIIEVTTNFNNIEIKINLDPDVVSHFMRSLVDITEAVDRRREMMRRRAQLEKKREHTQLHLVGFQAARLARRSGCKIPDIANQIATACHLSRERVIALAEVMEAKLNWRYMRIRNNSIRRRYGEGQKVETIARRFNLTKGRVSQIIHQGE